jgi:hypothetical protein
VKWLLLKDSAIRRRTDEALVRLVVPLGGTMTIDSATTVARSTAATLIPEVAKRIPAA